MSLDMNSVMAVRAQLREGKAVSLETLKACVSFLKEGRTSAAGKPGRKPAKPKVDKNDLDALMGEVHVAAEAPKALDDFGF